MYSAWGNLWFRNCHRAGQVEVMSSSQSRVSVGSDQRHYTPSWVLYEKAPAEPWLFRGIALQTMYKHWNDNRASTALDVPAYSSLRQDTIEEIRPFLGIWRIGQGANPTIDSVFLGEGPLAYLKHKGVSADAPLSEQTPEPNYSDVRNRMLNVRDKRHTNYCVKSMAYLSSPFGRYEALYLPFGDETGETVTHVIVAFSFVFGFDNTNWVFGGV